MFVPLVIEYTRYTIPDKIKIHFLTQAIYTTRVEHASIVTRKGL